MSTQSRDQNRRERAAAITAAAARKQRNQRVALVAGILVVLGAIVAAGTWYGSGRGDDDSADFSGIALAQTDSSIKVGPSSAPVSVVIYEDFLCPYCRQLEQSTRDFLRESAAKGKVQVEYRPVNILTQATYSERAMNAFAAVLKNSTPAAAIKLHDLLFENQPYEQSADETTDADILDLVEEAGGDSAAVRDAIQTKDSAFFDAAAKQASAIGLTGTPTVLVNGKKLEGMDISQLVAAIEDAVSNPS